MFKNLTDFGMERNLKEAIGFYIVSLLLFILIGILLGRIFVRINPCISDEGIDIFLIVITVVYCITLYSIIHFKKQMDSSEYIKTLATVVGLIFILGEIFSLLFIAILTMAKNESETRDDEEKIDVERY
ncbi:MAG TPA: hypothetical protein VK071_02945 [Tissierellales bacterium]|nr:hypothetical protein [Tissierellales bacterium]